MMTGQQERRNSAVKPSGPGGLARRQAFDGLPNLIFSEWGLQVIEGGRLDEMLQVKGAISRSIGPEQRIVMREGRRSHVSLVGEHDAVNRQGVDPVLLLAISALAMEEGCVGVPVFERRDARALSSQGSLERSEAKV